MGTKFSQLWEDPKFIDPVLKEKINLKVEKISRAIEDGKNRNLSKENLCKIRDSSKYKP